MLKLLLDENLPRKLKFRFGDGYHVLTVPEMGWSSLKDSELLDEISQASVDYLITADKNLIHQQNTDKWAGKLVILDTLDNRYETLLPLVDIIKERLTNGEIRSFHLIKG
ncbi:DUF5615 family PIN-like protein [uncultured Fibrella sp.]|uniref:DUF5615 family PIN-like protein n=1 Tax=uncultured Fibrella sp. TaxID=1284596 RepID=UPI0035CC04D1